MADVSNKYEKESTDVVQDILQEDLRNKIENTEKEQESRVMGYDINNFDAEVVDEVEVKEKYIDKADESESEEYVNIPMSEDASITVDNPGEKDEEDEQEEIPKKTIYHITHNDADAVGCAIVSDHVKGWETLTIFNGYDNVDENIKSFLLSRTDEVGNLFYPDYVLITDISNLKEDTINFLERYILAAKEAGKSEAQLLWVDHHASNRHNEELEWCTVVSEDSDGTPVSAAKLLFNLFYKDIEEKYKKFLGVYVESVSRYDTWEWKKHPSNYTEEYTAILIKQMGLVEAYQNISYSLVQSVEQDAENFTFTPELSILLKTYIDKRKKVLEHVLDHAVQTDFAEYSVALIIPDQVYFDECMEQVYLEAGDDIDFVMGLAPKTRSISFRSNKNDLNLGRFAKKYFGGGGHPQAAGATNIPTHTFIHWMDEYYTGLDYVNSKEYKKKEKKKNKKKNK